MKILVTAASSSSRLSGVQRHAFNLVRCLLLRPEIASVHLVIAPWQHDLLNTAGLRPDPRLNVHIAKMEQSAFSRNAWYWRGLPQMIEKTQPDLLQLTYPAPMNRAAFRCPTVLTLHDLYPFEMPGNFGYPQVLVNRMILRNCLRGADRIACVSDTTLDCLRHFASESLLKKAVRVYNSVAPAPSCVAMRPFDGSQDEPFLLTVAQHRRNKNISLLIRVYRRLLRLGAIDPSTRLVIVGIRGPETRRLHDTALRCGVPDRVLFVDGLSEEALRWCYARCEALVLPSITEGFGLPLAEALLAGCRVVCSNIPAFREVGNSNCRFVSLGAGEEARFAGAISATLKETRPLPHPLPQFSCEVVAGEYVDLYRRLLCPSEAVARLWPVVPVSLAPRERQTL